jgi:hypothetical protein
MMTFSTGLGKALHEATDPLVLVPPVGLGFVFFAPSRSHTGVGNASARSLHISLA